MTTKLPENRAELQRELDVHIESLDRLGPGYREAVAASMMERLERMIDDKIEARAGKAVVDRVRIERERTGQIAVTMALGIPLTAIAGGIAEVEGIIAVWIALVIILFVPRPK